MDWDNWYSEPPGNGGLEWLKDNAENDDLIDWDKVDLNDPRLDSVRNNLESTVSVIELILKKIDAAESVVHNPELEEKKIRLQAALELNNVLLDAANKVITVRDMTK